MQEITPCLWFDTEGEEAAKFYTSGRVMQAMMGMRKIAIAGLERAAAEA